MNVLGIYPQIGTGEKSPGTKRYFPWGFATVLRCIEIDGHIVDVLDIYGRDMDKEEVLHELHRKKYDAACLSGFASYNYSYVLWLANEIKLYSPDTIIIVGGVLADHHYNLLLRDSKIDFCIIGEGENTAPELLKSLNNPWNVNGIAFLYDDEVIRTRPRELIKDLDTLPMPDFDMWEMQPYLETNLWADDKTTRYQSFTNTLPPHESLHPNMSLFFGRGCPFHCKFCSRSYHGMRHKTVDHVISEIQFLQRKFKIKAVHFYDELVVMNRSIATDLAKKIKNLEIYWDCQARVNTVDYELMKILKENNCYSIGFGFESGSDTVLLSMGKGTTRQQNDQVLEWARKTGMHLKIQIMCGYPGETEEDTMQTVEMMKHSGLPPRRMSWTTPMPGSELYHESAIPDESAYLKRLGQQVMNDNDGIVLNISGMPDDEMMDLYRRANAQMEFDFKPSVKSYVLSRKWLSKYAYNLREVLK